ncbi:MAG: hypothetical protein EA404_15910 [Spirochaetaceae bacterium]|nr:MAG: hypothetical protein EA404_15910 [Spirochaetaceae bacterium]
MKRLLLIVLVLAFAAPVFADDALTLPTGVWRTRVVPVYSFARNEFDGTFGVGRSGSDADLDVLSLGFALEYGVTDWITIAGQWTPGFTVWSNLDADVPNPLRFPATGDDVDGDISVGRWFDLFLGAKLQLIGENAPARRNDVRLAIAPGVKVPFPAPDWDDEQENLEDDDDFIISGADKNLLGFGGRLYIDYVFSPRFFLNFYTELIAYPGKGPAPSVLVHKLIDELNGLSAFGADVDLANDKFEYGYDLTVEIEPTYIHTASPGLRITPSLPITFNYSPEPKLDGTRMSEIEVDLTPLPGGVINPFASVGHSSLLSVAPTVEFFFTGLTVPTALEIAYRYPVAGVNSNATNVFVIQVKNYLKFW